MQKSNTHLITTLDVRVDCMINEFWKIAFLPPIDLFCCCSTLFHYLCFYSFCRVCCRCSGFVYIFSVASVLSRWFAGECCYFMGVASIAIDCCPCIIFCRCTLFSALGRSTEMYYSILVFVLFLLFPSLFWWFHSRSSCCKCKNLTRTWSLP